MKAKLIQYLKKAISNGLDSDDAQDILSMFCEESEEDGEFMAFETAMQDIDSYLTWVGK